MAGGYLGKISAVVAANTGDYVRKLNDSASQTKAFARTISSDLGRASREASRSIESILTPLQRFERAIQNAASRKLAFRGFDGAIETVEQLRKAIAKIQDKPTELRFLLKESGLRSLEQIRQTIGAISEKDLQLAVNVGGLDGLKRLRADVQEINGKLVNVAVKTDAGELDRLIAVFEQIAPEKVRQLKIAVETRQIAQAVELNEQLVSVATKITSAYGRAKQQFAGFSLEVQAALGPGLRGTDSGILKVLEDIEARIPITEQRFAALAKAAREATQAMGRVGEADRMSQGLSGGESLLARRPEAARELDRAGRLQSQVADAGGMSNAADLFARQKAVAEALVVELGKMEAAQLQIGGGVRVTTKEYERQLAALRAINTQIQQSASARGNADRVNAVVSGTPQNFDQGRALQSQLESQVALLNRSQRQDFKPLLSQAADLSLGSTPDEYEKFLDVLQRIQLLLSKTQRLNLDADKAKTDADRLKESLDTLRADIRFRVTGDFQSVEQAKAAVESLAGRLGELGSNQAASLRPQFDKVVAAIGTGDLNAVNKEFSALQSQFGTELQLKVDADEATAEFTSVRDSLKQIRDLAAFKITGQFQSLDQAKAAVDKVVDSLGKLGAQQAAGLGPQIGNALRAINASAANPGDASLRKAALDSATELNAVFGKEYEIKVNADDATEEFQKLKRRREELSKDLRVALDAVPESARGRFVGRATEIATTLTNPSATSGDVDAAAASAKKLKEEMTAVTSQVNKFSGTFKEAFEASQVDSANAKLRVLQQILIRAGVSSGEAVEKAEELAAEYERAASSANGFLTRAKQIAAAEKEAVAAAQRRVGGGVNVDRQFSRAGDIGRGGFDKFSLGLQQAAFAVDDFFSATGGFDQKIRAISNNLTQLGFIVGGTTGLFVALGVAVAAQAAIGIAKFVRGGKTAEDMAKTLNDSLEKQKTLANELRDSFKSLGETIASKGFSEATNQGRAFRKELEEIIKKQREAREERALEANPRAVEVGSQINRLNRELKDVTDVGQAAAIRDRIRSLEAEREQLRRSLPARGAPTLREVQNSIGFRGFESNTSLFAGIALDTIGIGGAIADLIAGESAINTRVRIGRADSEAAGRLTEGDRAGLLAAIDNRINNINNLAERPLGITATLSGESRNIIAAREERARLQDLRSRFENANGDELLRQFAETANAAADELQVAQEQVANAIKDGVPNAVALNETLTGFTQQIADANKAIDAAIKEFEKNPREAGAAQRRDDVISRQTGIITNATEARRAATASASSLSRVSAIDQATTSQARLERVRSNLSSLGIDNGPLASRLRAFEFQRQEAERRLTQAQRDGSSERQVQAIAGTLDALRRSEQGYDAATSAVRQFADALVRAGDRALQQAQQRRDAAIEADITGGTDRTRFERQRAEEDVRAVEQATNRRNESLQRFIEQNQQNGDVQLLARFNEQLARGRTTTPQQDAANQQRIAELERQIAAGEAFAEPAIDPALRQRAEANATALSLQDNFERLVTDAGLIASDTFESDIENLRANVGDAVANDAQRIYEQIQEAARSLGEASLAEFWRSGREAADQYAQAVDGSRRRTAENAAALEENRRRLAELNAEIANQDQDLAPEQRQQLEQARQETIRRLAANNQALQNDLQAPANADALIESRNRGEALIRQAAQIDVAEQLRQQLLDISRAQPIPGLNAQENEASRQRASDAARLETVARVAPLLFQFREERINAQLQGPSRAALNVADAQTVEGARELNRLLRGDDPAKDVNLTELQRQTSALGRILEWLERNGQGGIVDIRG